MKKRIIIFSVARSGKKNLTVLLSIVFMWMFFVTGAQPGRYFTIDGRNIEIQSFNQDVEKMMDEVGVPGVSLAVIDNNQIVFYDAYGHKQSSGKKKVNKNTVFEACSLSKSFLVYAAFKLADAGKLDLDKPMYQYMEPGPALAHDLRYRLITPRMILSHSSGLENWKRYNDKDLLEIESNPGEKFVYSGTGYHYLSSAIEIILKESYEEYIKRIVIEPLKLKGSYLKFKEKRSHPFHKGSPWNYALGHNSFGEELEKWKNYDPFPASGNNITAEDYAKLILATFDKKHLSEKSVNTILKPLVSTGMEGSHFGTGFEIIYVDGDTIIAQGGDNSGFKAQLLYSVKHKKGFVMLTNSDRGKYLTAHLCKVLMGLNMYKHFNESVLDQYPSNAINLFKIYREKDSTEMFAAIEKLKYTGEIGDNTLYTLGWEFINHDLVISRKLLEQNTVLYPKSKNTYGILGEVYMRLSSYDLAYKNFEKAKELGFNVWNMDNKLKECEKKIAEAERRSLFTVNVGDKEESIIQAENYNAMQGIEVLETVDAGGGHNVGYIDTGDWMEYKVNVSTPGEYKVTFRVSSQEGGSRIELRSDTAVLTTLDIASTQEWNNWTTLTTHVNILEGNRTLRLYASSGGFAINWLQFFKSADHENK